MTSKARFSRRAFVANVLFAGGALSAAAVLSRFPIQETPEPPTEYAPSPYPGDYGSASELYQWDNQKTKPPDFGVDYRPAVQGYSR